VEWEREQGKDSGKEWVAEWVGEKVAGSVVEWAQEIVVHNLLGEQPKSLEY